MIKKLRACLDWFLGKPKPHGDPIVRALNLFRNSEADTLELTRQLVAALRPQNRRDRAAPERYQAMLQLLEADAGLRAAFRGHIVHFIATRRLVTFFTESGILPGTGFFSEWWRILGSRLLPEVPDERRLKDCLHVIYDRSDDWQWLQEIAPEASQRFWALIAPAEELRNIDWRGIQEQMLDAVLLLAHRVSGLGVESELMRASPNFDDDTPRFVALSAEAVDFVNAFRAALNDPAVAADDGSQLLVIADQCRDTLQRIRKRALTVGTSLHLSYLLTRSEQSLERLHELAAILIAGQQATTRDEAIQSWGEFAHAAFLAENRRNSLRFYVGQLSRLLAVRVTENAARSGEHYICETPADYRQMWRSAAGAGVIIGCMALLKIKAAALNAPLFGEAFLYSMIYGLGFVLIFLLGMTVATKQPAMTAQTLASLLGDLRLSRGADLIADLDPLPWALPHAAIAGFYLFLSGLITGYFDNRAAYADIGPRLARLRWLRALFGRDRAGRIGAYIQDRLGGIMGNFLFGCMLGSTGIIGTILGLPLDIRHIAFASANLGYALVGFQLELPLKAIAWAAFGVVAIGFTNLAVSFTLALRTAMRARGIQFEHGGLLLKALWHRLKLQPRSFVLPPRPVADA